MQINQDEGPLENRGTDASPTDDTNPAKSSIGDRFNFRKRVTDWVAKQSRKKFVAEFDRELRGFATDPNKPQSRSEIWRDAILAGTPYVGTVKTAADALVCADEALKRNDSKGLELLDQARTSFVIAAIQGGADLSTLGIWRVPVILLRVNQALRVANKAKALVPGRIVDNYDPLDKAAKMALSVDAVKAFVDNVLVARLSPVAKQRLEKLQKIEETYRELEEIG